MSVQIHSRKEIEHSQVRGGLTSSYTLWALSAYSSVINDRLGALNAEATAQKDLDAASSACDNVVDPTIQRVPSRFPKPGRGAGTGRCRLRALL